MKGTESGQDKVKKICDILRKETLDPAIDEAEQILHSAKERASEIVAEAGKEAEKMKEEARQEIERQRNVFQSSLNQACKQALEVLKQNIEERLFDRELARLLAKHTSDPKVLAQLIEAVIKALEKEGIEGPLSIYLPAAVSPRAVSELLARGVLDQLQEKNILIGPLTGGIEVKLHRDNITLDLSDKALKELVASYIRKDFRELIFSSLST
jgi:V/A-type H+/Na+-transporting ATPase subunit E